MWLLRPSTRARDALTGACKSFLTPIHQKFGELLSLVVDGVISWEYAGDILVDITNQNFYQDVIYLMSMELGKPAGKTFIQSRDWQRDETNGDKTEDFG